MCYDRRRAEACVDESAHHALANAGGREIVGKKEGEQKGSARGSVHWGCYYATALDIEVDPQRCGLGSCQSDCGPLGAVTMVPPGGWSCVDNKRNTHTSGPPRTKQKMSIGARTRPAPGMRMPCVVCEVCDVIDVCVRVRA